LMEGKKSMATGGGSVPQLGPFMLPQRTGEEEGPPGNLTLLAQAAGLLSPGRDPCCQWLVTPQSRS